MLEDILINSSFNYNHIGNQSVRNTLWFYNFINNELVKCYVRKRSIINFIENP